MANLVAENQVIERNLLHIPAGNVLLMDLPPDDALTYFSNQRKDINWFGYTPFFDTKTFFDEPRFASFDIEFSAWLNQPQTFDAIVIYYPKSKQRFDYYLSMASQRLNEGGVIYVVGEKKGGIKSCDKGLKPFVIKPNKIDSARHCMLYIGASNGFKCSKSIDHWFTEKSFDIEVAGQTITLQLASLPGTFSANRLDEGTELLLKSLDNIRGMGLDFGAGCGVISAAVGKRFDVKLIALDVDAMAIASSNRTFTLNQVDAKALPSNGLSTVLNDNLKVDFVVTNPPFHTGIDTDYSITEQFIKNCHKILKPSYQLWMVANAFLPYPELFKHYLKPVDIKSKNKRFNIYRTGTTIN